MRSLTEVALEIGKSVEDLLGAQKSIALHYPHLVRVEGVSFEHHACLLRCSCGKPRDEHLGNETDELTCLEIEPQEVPNTMFWLLLVKEHGWSVVHLKETVY